MANCPMGRGPMVVLLILLGNNLNFSVSYYYTVKRSMESEEQESNLTNPRMALVPGSAPFQSYNPSLDEREIFALVQYILFPLV